MTNFYIFKILEMVAERCIYCNSTIEKQYKNITSENADMSSIK